MANMQDIDGKELYWLPAGGMTTDWPGVMSGIYLSANDLALCDDHVLYAAPEIGNRSPEIFRGKQYPIETLRPAGGKRIIKEIGADALSEILFLTGIPECIETIRSMNASSAPTKATS